jgi:hypothetical protein
MTIDYAKETLNLLRMYITIVLTQSSIVVFWFFQNFNEISFIKTRIVIYAIIFLLVICSILHNKAQNVLNLLKHQ